MTHLSGSPQCMIAGSGFLLRVLTFPVGRLCHAEKQVKMTRWAVSKFLTTVGIFSSFGGNEGNALVFHPHPRAGSMPLSPEQCRKRAAACWRAARSARNPDAAQQFRDLAQAWIWLAERGERQPDWRIDFVRDKKSDTSGDE
jgi:hypothetical protein